MIIIEIQNNYLTDYLLRMNYGTSKLITDNMVAGMPYSMVKKVISINIVYFDLGKGEDYIYNGTTNFIGLHKKDILKLSITEQDIYLRLLPIHTDTHILWYLKKLYSLSAKIKKIRCILLQALNLNNCFKIHAPKYSSLARCVLPLGIYKE